MAKLALALLAAPAAAFNFGGGGGAPARAAVDTTADIGVDPGPIEPTGPFWEDQEGLARRRAVEIKHGRIAMMAFIGMIVEELGVTFPGSINLDGSVQFADILKDGMGFPAISNIPVFGLYQCINQIVFDRATLRRPDSLVDLCTGLFQIVAFAGFAEIGAMPAAQYTGGPQNLPGGYDGSVGTIPGGYPFTTQIEDVTARNRALTCELQNGRAAMLGTFGAMCHSCVDSCDHRACRITRQLRARGWRCCLVIRGVDGSSLTHRTQRRARPSVLQERANLRSPARRRSDDAPPSVIQRKRPRAATRALSAPPRPRAAACPAG